MSYLPALQLMKATGRTTFLSTPITTLITNEILNEQKQLPTYDIKNDTYQYNTSTYVLSKIVTDKVGGTLTVVGTAS